MDFVVAMLGDYIPDIAQGIIIVGLWIIVGAFWCRRPPSKEGLDQ
jgi:ABC-type multidrug transport system permease subunit